MLATITGATGLVGSNLAIELLNQGHQVRCTKRKNSKIDHLKDFNIDWIEANLNDPESLKRAFSKSAVVFNCAALVSVRNKITPELVRTNIEGTHHVIHAVREAKVNRLVHCSSVVARALSKSGTPVSESEPWNFDHFKMDDGYAMTKYRSEQIVLSSAEIDAVIVNPTYMFGPYDVKPSSGKMIMEVISGKVPGHTSGYNNFVDVRDVCRGMISAWKLGRSGESYILGGVNMTYEDIMKKIALIADVPPPKIAIPKILGKALGFLGDIQEFITNKEVKLNSKMINYAFSDAFQFRSDKAILELDYSISSLDQAIQDAIDWFKINNMI